MSFPDLQSLIKDISREWHFLSLPFDSQEFRRMVFKIYTGYRPKGLEQEMPTLAEIQQMLILRGNGHSQSSPINHA